MAYTPRQLFAFAELRADGHRGRIREQYTVARYAAHADEKANKSFLDALEGE